MKQIEFLIVAILFSGIAIKAQQGIIIQEDSVGVCTMDGIVERSAEGYTGGGYANIDNGVDVGMSWSFTVETAGEYKFYWRYALGGSDVTSRDGRVLLNNSPVSDTVLFPHSGSSSWADWIYTDTITISLDAGYNKINLLSVTEKGLPNIDYFHALGSGIEAVDCTPAYTFKLTSGNAEAGSVDYNPKQDVYEEGTEITVTATSNTGYFFHSWSGEEASTQSNFTFTIQRNTELIALFYAEGTEADPEATGYATVQHDNGTPYLLCGGYGGDTVVAEDLTSLKNYLSADEPYVVKLGTLIEGENSEKITIASNKTLLGVDNAGHIKGIPVSIEGSRNVIIRNITFSKVIRYDELEITSGAQNVWLDHCDFYTDKDHHTDYYDGLLDVKNQARFITVSWSKFHDHFKSILISSGDQEVVDSVIRITFHHNYFYNCNSRLPSIRFGKAHIFSNLYNLVSTGVNSRMGACVKVENNYFENTGTAVGMFYSDEPGGAELNGNIFNSAGYSDDPACILDIPYEYASILTPAEDVPQTVIGGTDGPPLVSALEPSNNLEEVVVFPNPVKDYLTINLNLSQAAELKISLYSASGQLLSINEEEYFSEGKQNIVHNLGSIPGGIYNLVITNISTGEMYRTKLIVFGN